MTATYKTTKTGKLAARQRAIVSYHMVPTCYGLSVLVATLVCGHSVDTTLDAANVVIGQTKTRCIACGQA